MSDNEEKKTETKLDLGSLVGSVKSMINSITEQSNAPEVDPNDAIGQKIVEIQALTQSLAKVHQQQAKEFNQVNQLLSSLLQDLSALREQQAKPEENPAKDETAAEASATDHEDKS